MIGICVDLENMVQWLDGGKIDGSPFNPANKLVTVHWSVIEDGVMGPLKRAVFHHVEQESPDSPEELIHDLKRSEVFIAHNAKHDYSWLRESGFRDALPRRVWCTMVADYVLSSGIRRPLSLDAVATRRGVSAKKSEVTHALFKDQVGYERMPLQEVLDYGDGDVVSCAEIYLSQLEEYNERYSLTSVRDLMFEMLLFLVEIEANGVCIDHAALAEVEADYVAEKQQLEQKLQDIVEEVMGDTPINLNSGMDMTKVIYSRELIDKPLHIELFNIGTQPNGKPKYPPKMSQAEFNRNVRKTTRRVERTIAHNCPTCKGSGKIRKTKKDGTPYARENKCPECDGLGAIFQSTGKVAGLKLVPSGPRDASINGFSTDKQTIKQLIAQAEERNLETAQIFLNALTRLHAVNVYLDSFVRGIKRWVQADNILHPKFNQTTVITGRLSSSDPNFQNQPKSSKFPVRRAYVSRFEGGHVMEADFSQLEFRTAGVLANDKQIIDDVQQGKDVHAQTASVVHQVPLQDVTKALRDPSKPHTFAPLYGGTGAFEPPHIRKYFQEFFKIYHGVADWHDRLFDEVLNTGMLVTPTGREFKFPNSRRLASGRITNATAVVNYPVQSFATGDIVPLACIRALRKWGDLKSLLILTVHDSIVVDVYPGEEKEVAEILNYAMFGVRDEIKERFGFDFYIPLDIEINIGPNWMEMEEYGI